VWEPSSNGLLQRSAALQRPGDTHGKTGNAGAAFARLLTEG
jgi:hypothetical protein